MKEWMKPSVFRWLMEWYDVAAFETHNIEKRSYYTDETIMMQVAYHISSLAVKIEIIKGLYIPIRRIDICNHYLHIG